MAIFEGAGVALITPMNEDLSVNYNKLEEIIEEQIAGGTDAIIACGTTGEASTLTVEEHLDAIGQLVTPTKQAIIPHAVHSSYGSPKNFANAPPKVAPITNVGTISPPLKPPPIATAVKRIFIRNASYLTFPLILLSISQNPPPL